MNNFYVYDNIVLSKEDFDFYQSLPNQQKILFLYDLCLSVEEKEEDFETEINDSVITNETLKFIANESKNELYVYVVLVNKSIIFFGNSDMALSSAKRFFFNDGYIFIKSALHTNDINGYIEILQKFFKHYEVHDILSYSLPISLN
jgi:hypothetical protein